DTGIRNLANQYLSDGVLNRADMIGIFAEVRQDGTVSSTEFSDLGLIVNNSSLFSGVGYVQVLASDVVLGNSANDHYQGSALRNPSAIENMFIVNGDGTYTVRFFNGSSAEYVTVDSFLPTDSSGSFVFANMGGQASSSSNELWVALAEKAYVQLNECTWLRP